MISLLFRVGVALGLAGMALGIFMGIRQDFALAPAHAHLNLLGFVALFLAALYYRVVPEAAESRLAKLHAIAAIVGAALFPVGIGCVLYDHERFQALVVAGALTVFAAMLLFAVVVFRVGGGAQ